MSAYDTIVTMGNFFYREWYLKDIKPNLTKKEKEEILKQISDISLERNIVLPNIKIELDEIPKLKKFAHTEDFSGFQIYTVMQEIFRELYPNQSKTIFGEKE